jgi:hypothetical protein
MPSLDDLLNRSMLFTATRGREHADPVTGKFRTSRPVPQTAADLGEDLDAETIRSNPIWQFSWDPASPATFTDLTLLSRGMGMDYRLPVTAYDRLAFRDVEVVRTGERRVKLPLEPEYMIGAWEGRVGRISQNLFDKFRNPGNLWKLDTRIDASLLVAFGYRLAGAEPSPLSMVECEALGDDLMPPPGTVRPPVTFTAEEGARAIVRVDYPRYIVAVELVLCRESPDFVPGDMVGFARIHPHALVWSTEALDRVETTILMARPRKAMNHGDSAMHSRHKALLVTDTNEPHTKTAELIDKPLPWADAIYDYYELDPVDAFGEREPTEQDHPLQRRGEVTLADARFHGHRRIRDAVTRRSPTVKNDRDIYRSPRQGQFDNVHIAPRMRLVMDILLDGRGDVVVADDLPMVFLCLHDCCHMHVRWSAMFDEPAVNGWKDGVPNVAPGVPAVPENQTVFASFPNEHTLRYRAVAEAVAAGDLSVFCHHGLAYAVHIWPGLLGMSRVRDALNLAAFGLDEPFASANPLDWIHGKDNSSAWALFYFRVRLTGVRDADTPLGWRLFERLDFDREKCLIPRDDG